MVRAAGPSSRRMPAVRQLSSLASPIFVTQARSARVPGPGQWGGFGAVADAEQHAAHHRVVTELIEHRGRESRWRDGASPRRYATG